MAAAFHIFLANRMRTDIKVETTVKRMYTKNGENSRECVYSGEIIARLIH